jgi:soluble lytic murein transglycosylase
MARNEPAVRSNEVGEHPLRPLNASARDQSKSRTIVIRHGSGWQWLAFFSLGLLLLTVVMLGHRELRTIDRQHQDDSVVMARVERKIQQLESGIAFDSQRRYLLLGMRDHIMRVNPRVSLGDAYRYAELALSASEKYPAVDPLLLLAIGTVESRYDPQAKSHADARGLYQVWPSTGRLLLRSLGWSYDEAALYDPEKNTEAAALYLDILFSTYSDPQLVLAEYNGGPLNAGYYRAGVGALATETRNYVPQVLALYGQLKEKFAQAEFRLELMHRDANREGKTLAGSPSISGPVADPAPRARDKAAPAAVPKERPPQRRQAN